MPETSTDYLYVVPPQLQDRSFAASTPDRDGSFDEHLTQASSNATEENRTSSTFSQRASSSSSSGSSDQIVYADQSSRPAESISKTGQEKTSTASAPSSPSATTEQPADGGQTEAAANHGKKQDDPNKRDHSADAQLAAATHVTAQNEHKLLTTDRSKAKVVTDAVAVAPEASKQASTSREVANTLVNGQSHSIKAEPKEGDESSDSSVVHATDDQTVDAAAAAKQAKNQKPKHNGKVQLEAAEDDASQADSPQRSLDEKVPAETGQNVNRVPGVSVADLKAKAELASDDRTSDDPRHSSDKDAKAGPAASPAEHANKVVAAQFVDATAVSADGPIASAAAKNDKDEQAVKPVAGTNESAAASFARLSRAGAGIGRESGATAADNLPQVDTTRFVGRVAKAFQTAQERGGSLQIRLSPPELGALRLELTVKDGVMSASLQTENSSARRLLLDHLPTLRDRLAEQNIRVDRFDVDVRRDASDSQADARGSQHQQFQHQPEQASPRRQFASQQEVLEPTAPMTAVVPNVSDAGLNLII
jgi:flagellar hook-length control protein FliK